MSELRRQIIHVKCPKCKGAKGIYGKSDRNYPATLPCDKCDATGTVDINTLSDEEKMRLSDTL